MSSQWKTLGGYLVSTLILALALSGCGGGGGGGSTPTVDLTNPAASYAGVTTQATVSAANAEDLAMGAYGSADFMANVGLFSLEKDDSTTANKNRLPILPAIQAIKNSARRMDIPGKAVQQRNSAPPTAGVKMSGQVVDYQIPGPNGGVASFSFDINEATGSFSGSVVYQEFNAGGIVFNGRANLLGSLDANWENFTRLTLNFSSLSLSHPQGSLSLVGSLSWGFNYNAATENLSINLALIEGETSKTYWLNNYEIVTVYNVGNYSQTFAGRYYDHDYGYVDVETLSPLVTHYLAWPSQGALKFSGQHGTWVRMSCDWNQVLLEAETDGTGAIDWQTQWATNQTVGGNPTDNGYVGGVVTPVNAPPTANAGPDQTVVQWATVQLDGRASSDPDGDPLSYSWHLDSRPAFSNTTLIGANTAQPQFIPDTAGSYVLNLTVFDGYYGGYSDTVTIVVTPLPSGSSNLAQHQWKFGIFGSYIGQAGLFVSDLDGDGKPEIIASASTGGFGANSQWYVLRQGVNGGYEQIWRSDLYAAAIARLALADLNGDGIKEVIVALADGTIRSYDGPTLTGLRQLTLPAPLVDMALADLDGDGTLDIVTSDGLGILVSDSKSGVRKWSIGNAGGNSIAVGNVDTDPALEIVATANGGKGYVIDGVSQQIQWEYVNGFGAQVGLGDLDGDGMQEIVGASAWNKITILDADRKTPSWEISTSHDIAALRVIDTDEDGIPEILYGDGQWGKVRAIDVQNRAEKWSVANPEHGVSGLAFGDVDMNGKSEILWGAGGSSSGPDHLFIADPETGAIKWKNLDYFGLSAIGVGDLNNDAEDEIVMLSRASNSGYDGGILHRFNARTHALAYQQTLEARHLMGDGPLKLGDVDGDSRTELVVATGDGYDGILQVYDGATLALKRQSSSYNGNFFSALAIGDVDNDGRIEIVAGQGRAHTGAQGVYLIVFDGATLQEKWRSVDLGNAWGKIYAIKLADLDGDGRQEIIASTTESRLVIFDGGNHTLKLMIESPARALEVADIDGDGGSEVLVGRTDGKIDVFDGSSYILKKTVSTFGTAAVDALRVEDLDGDGSSEWLIASGGVLSVLEAEQLQWRSGNLGSNLGLGNHLEVKDTDGDGRKEIFIGSDIALFQFK